MIQAGVNMGWDKSCNGYVDIINLPTFILPMKCGDDFLNLLFKKNSVNYFAEKNCISFFICNRGE